MIHSYKKSDLLIPFGCIPVLYFLIGRLVCFLDNAWSIAVPASVAYAALVAGSAVVFAARGAIAKYLSLYKNSTKSVAAIYIICGALCIACSGIVLSDCGNNSNLFALLGGWVLLGTVANLVYGNLRYIAGKLADMRIQKSDIVFLLALLAALNIQAVLYCTFMRKIFVWDNAGYFTTVHMLDDIFPSAEYFKTVFRSVFTTDYNYIIAIPANIMCALFGKSRLVFILAIINFYVFPLFALIYAAAKKFFAAGKSKVVCILLLLPYIIFAANTGFIDIGCALPALAAAALYLYCDRDKASWICGILLALCILMRRWYSFWSLSFVATALVHGIVTKRPKPALELVGGCAFVLLFFAQSFVSGKLLADYGSMYSAYALGIKYDILIFTRYFGIVAPAAVAAYCIYKAAKCAKLRKKCPEAFLLVQMLVCFGLFVSVQTHGQQHLALYIPGFVLIFLSAAAALRKRHAVIPLAAVCALHTANTFVPRVQPTAISQIEHPALLPDYSAYPPVDPAAQNILDITEYADREIGANGKTMCLLASSLELNYDTLKNAEISLSVKQKHNIDRSTYYLPIADIDNRDGLSHNLFDADYVLVPSSLQIHLAEDEQQVIAVPYRHITQGTAFGTAYEKEDISFVVSDGTQMYVYRRTSEITSEERQNIYNEIFN